MTVQNVFQSSSNGVAAAAITSPAWLPPLESASQVAAEVLPILGAFWLVVQIVFYIRAQIKKDDDE